MLTICILFQFHSRLFARLLAEDQLSISSASRRANNYMTFRYDCANVTSIAADACCISAVISECHIAYNTVSHVYYFYILGGVKFTYVVSTTRCIYTCPVSSGMRPRPPPSDLYYKTHDVTMCKQPLYIFFMLFFIKIKLSSRLCLTHKRVTQKYRNSTLI